MEGLVCGGGGAVLRGHAEATGGLTSQRSDM